jgi:hypothetical protein
MRVLNVIRVPGEQTYVLQCGPCGVSTTKTVDAPGPATPTADFGAPKPRRATNPMALPRFVANLPAVDCPKKG